jgi:ABC-type nitrate/sulfonate/bicarbonate transport system permease component
MKQKMIPWAQRIFSVLVFLTIWHIASHTGIFGRVSVKASSLLLPDPFTVFKSFLEMIISGYLPKHLGISFIRVMKGFAIAAAIGVPLGIAMGMSKSVKNFTSPIFRTFSPIPGVAWVPLAILWFGLGDKAAVFIIVMGAIAPIIINANQGVNDVDRNLLQALYSMNASKWQIVRKCIIPSIVPYLVSGFRLGLGFAWRVVIAAEMVGVPDGMGYALSTGRSTGRTEVTIVTIISLGIVMILLEQVLFAFLEKTTSHWRSKE